MYEISSLVAYIFIVRCEINWMENCAIPGEIYKLEERVWVNGKNICYMLDLLNLFLYDSKQIDVLLSPFFLLLSKDCVTFDKHTFVQFRIVNRINCNDLLKEMFLLDRGRWLLQYCIWFQATVASVSRFI